MDLHNFHQEETLLAYVLQAQDGQQSDARWLEIQEVLTNPFMFFNTGHQHMAIAFDMVLHDGVPLDAGSLTTHLQQIHKETAYKTFERFKMHEKAGTLIEMNIERRRMIAEPWATSDECTKDSVLDVIGGFTKIGHLGTMNVVSSSIMKIAHHVKSLYDKRHLRNMCTSAIDALKRPDGKADFIANDMMKKLGEVICDNASMRDAAEVIDELIERDDEINPAVADWSLKELNEIVPLRGGSLIVIGGTPGSGKTSLAAQIAQYTAQEATGGAILYITMEMTEQEIVAVMIAQRLRRPRSEFENGGLSERTQKEIREESIDFSERHPMNIVDGSRMTYEDIFRHARLAEIHSKNGLKIIIVDHLHLLSKTHPRQSDIEHLSDTTRELKILAKKTGACVVLLSQLNRKSTQAGYEKDGHAKAQLEPMMSDLRGSGSIEQDANAIVLLWRRDNGEENMAHVTACIVKNRGGRIGKVETTFHAGSGQYFFANHEANEVKRYGRIIEEGQQ